MSQNLYLLIESFDQEITKVHLRLTWILLLEERKDSSNQINKIVESPIHFQIDFRMHDEFLFLYLIPMNHFYHLIYIEIWVGWHAIND